MKRATLLLLALAIAAPAHAGPWVREPGRFFVNTSYARIATQKLFAPDFKVVPIAPYEQHLWTFYGEIGVTPWLMATVDGTVLRYNELTGQGATLGPGDWRFGFWTPIVRKPLRLAFALTIGAPTGDARPSAGKGASAIAEETARSLPTGDGETDVDLRLSLGYSWGGVRRWPVRQYLVAEAGYWVRTAFHDSFVWRLEVGTQFPWRVVDRFWVIWRIHGVESFASNDEAAMNATGLGDGVTYVSYGITLFGRIWKGLGASIGADSALRARSVPAAAQLFVGLSYER
jgi:hypothetical protein